MSVLAGGSSTLEIGADGLAHIDRHRQDALAPTLAANEQLAAIPVAILQLQSDDLASPQTQARQQQQHSTIAKADRGGEVTAVDGPLGMLRGDRLGHSRRTCPAGHRRHGSDEFRRDIATILGISKERAQPVDDALHRRGLQALGLPLHEPDDIDGANSAQINCTAAEALHKELASDLPVALNRGVRQALLVLQVVCENGGKIVGRRRRHASP